MTDKSGAYHAHHAPKPIETDACRRGQHEWYTFKRGRMADIDAGRPVETWVACGNCQKRRESSLS